ncbi:MAG TPA: adenylate/guanylate cyclase domain-containing protein [Candidatus Eremiobacteraceae bacterium]|nr:adenylate/guanylate cyclase domain-containing protein [Candidatus Eremiobacteraceae bacterium]
MPRPSGTIAFLFSDIEGSTKRWESHPEAMQTALRRHDELMKAAIAAHDGHIFKTIGDAYCAAFHRVPEAVAAAMAAQRAVSSEDWQTIGGLTVRMAVHAGLADERDGDYFGPTVNRVARLLSIAHGGQIILSSAAAGLIKSAPSARVQLRDLGPHRLRDLANAEQVYQVVADDLRGQFPALRSVDSLPNNLPLQLSSFVGREAEVAALRKLMEETRIATVVGTGGIGKTRAALEVAADMLESAPDGVWFADLAPIADPILVASVLANALGVRESESRSTLEEVVDHLRLRKTLLILDNCEHVVAEAARVADAILRHCPNVKILATSREALAINGEHIFRMPALSMPSADVKLTLEDALTFSAIALFAERARASDPRFQLTSENAPTVAEICRSLDGIALAIELAAPRVKIFSPRQLADRLDERFRVLTGGNRAALPRQQTMRALIGWSYDLLADRERAFFRKLGIFCGGWDLDAATAICGEDESADWEVLDLMSALVDKSLVHAEIKGDVQRFRLLESTKAYAVEELRRTGEFDATSAAHARIYLDVARRVDHLFIREGKTDDASELAMAEIGNLRAAMQWSLIDGHDEALGCEIAARLSILWWRALRVEGTRWLKAAKLCRLDSPEIEARILLALSHVLPDSPDRTATAAASAAAFRALDDPLATASALHSEAEARRALGEYQAANGVQTEAVALYRAHGTDFQVATALLTLGSIETIVGNRQAARMLLEESRALDPRIGSAATNLGELEFADGNFELAVTYGQEALNYFRNRNRLNECVAHCNLAAYFLMLERISEARDSARQGFEIALAMRIPDLVALAIQHLASIAVASGAAEQAAQLLGFVEARYAALGLHRDTSEQMTYERLRAKLADIFSDDDLQARLASGAALTEERAVSEARLI